MSKENEQTLEVYKEKANPITNNEHRYTLKDGENTVARLLPAPNAALPIKVMRRPAPAHSPDPKNAPKIPPRIKVPKTTSISLSPKI